MANVVLLKSDRDKAIDVLFTAARTCYSQFTPSEILDSPADDETRVKLIKKVLSSGHHSILEHISISFAIEGVSRSLTHQLVRHRLCTYSQASQRYIDFKGKDPDWVIPPAVMVDRHAKAAFDKALKAIKEAYDLCRERRIKPEDARYIFPNAAPTNIVVSTNLRNLIHIMGLRCCTRAQWEIRAVFLEMAEICKKEFPFIKEMFAPNCEQLGYCPESDKCCGKHLTIEEIKKR